MLLLISYGAHSQQTTRMRINEVLVINQDNYVDDYGQKVPWFELFNSSYNMVNIGGCYLTDDISNPKKYMIPKGDILTKVQTRQHVLFFADNKPSRGTFHLNFSLKPDTINKIFLFDANGVRLIDSVTVPKELPANVSWGRLTDGENTWGFIQKVTPGSNNKTLDSNDKMENFSKKDSFGFGMSVTAMGVVFAILLLLTAFFHLLATISIKLALRRNGGVSGVVSKPLADGQVPGEVIAAISMAIFELGNDAHDIENTVLTIARTRRSYSPWSSKIYGLRQVPDKK